jgi:hypothetical protein
MKKVELDRASLAGGPNVSSWADEVQEEADAKERETSKTGPQPSTPKADTDKSRKPLQAGPKQIVPKETDRREAGPTR